MSFALLALIVAVGLLGPLLAANPRWRIPVVVGELAGGLLIGATGFAVVDPTDDTFTLLANIGFGLTMVLVGSGIPLRDQAVRATVVRGMLGAVVVGVVGAGLAVVLAAVFGTGHSLLYGVLLTSSSAALVLPMLQSSGVEVRSTAQLVAQIAIADIICIVLLPLVMAPDRVPQILVAGGVIAAVCAVIGLVLSRAGQSDRRERFHEFSEQRRFALELRLSLLVLFGLAAVAQYAAVSVMLAGFAVGLLLAAVGEPRRLARQLFGMTEGFFGPLFFVWLGASLDLRGLLQHPIMILLGIALALSALIAHLTSRAVGLPWSQAAAATGQLGVPVAAVTLGIQSNSLALGEDAAIILGALVTVAIAAIAVGVLARRSHPTAPEQGRAGTRRNRH